MAGWSEVERACRALPGTEAVTDRRGLRSWQVAGRAFVWERPLRKGDLEELGDAAPAGPVLAAFVPDEGAKQALIAEEPAVYFTTSHFDGHPSVLCRLDELAGDELEELVGEAWSCRAPKRLLGQGPVSLR